MFPVDDVIMQMLLATRKESFQLFSPSQWRELIDNANMFMFPQQNIKGYVQLVPRRTMIARHRYHRVTNYDISR